MSYYRLSVRRCHFQKLQHRKQFRSKHQREKPYLASSAFDNLFLLDAQSPDMTEPECVYAPQVGGYIIRHRLQWVSKKVGLTLTVASFSLCVCCDPSQGTKIKTELDGLQKRQHSERRSSRTRKGRYPDLVKVPRQQVAGPWIDGKVHCGPVWRGTLPPTGTHECLVSKRVRRKYPNLELKQGFGGSAEDRAAQAYLDGLSSSDEENFGDDECSDTE